MWKAQWTVLFSNSKTNLYLVWNIFRVLDDLIVPGVYRMLAATLSQWEHDGRRAPEVTSNPSHFINLRIATGSLSSIKIFFNLK